MQNGNPGKKPSPRPQATAPAPSVPDPIAPAQESGAEAAPPGPPTPFPIVGIGASAGGLAAFEAFFSGMPADRDPGMAFVLVQHLAPDHKSILSELVRGYTHLQVFEVQDAMVVQPNCIYVIPPNHDIGLLHGTLHLLEPTLARGQRLPIDYFFKSLAQDQHELAIGVVLSGTGSDGTMGVRAIKDAGGMVMAQNTASCEFDGMPRSAIATGLVDYQLTPAQMPAQIMAYVRHAFGKLPVSGKPATPLVESALNKIFVLLRSQTGHDFSQYKPSTIYRRIERRMALQQLDSVAAYVKYLQQTASEIDALFGDLLIGVTNFFRDPEAFAALESDIIPPLFTGKPAHQALRIWSVGCSTGEEAYSLAILLVEHMEALKQNHTVQVFATDIDARAIASARLGVFSASIAPDLGPERLARFFTLEPDGQSYRIQKRIRDLLVFSEHDLIKDPPFSKLDLICCRNLLIYLDSDLQKRLIPLFHYALNPGGILFLGSSEGIGEFDSLFTVLHRKAKLFQRKEDLLGGQRASLNRLAPSMAVADATLPHRSAHRAALAPKLPLRELMEQALLRHIAPASALVNAGGDIVYLHGRTGMYLEPTAGEAGIQNILKMAREGLRLPLNTALHETVSTQTISTAPAIRVKTNGHFTLVNLSVHPVAMPAPDMAGGPGAPLYLVMLQDAPEPALLPTGLADDGGTGTIAPDLEARIHALTQELHAKDEYLQSTHEKLEISNEELRSSNEEMLSVNEELQSTNEELETSKEELQSINEELTTVNSELHNKVIDLSRANNDMNNLLASTGIGTVLVDFQLRILRFTPAASTIINLIASDVGRPVSHIASNLVGYTSLVPDIQSVLHTLAPVQHEVKTPEGQWYTLSIQPYRTLDNVIEGAVITFVDITELVHTREALQEANALQRLALVARDAQDAIAVQDLNGRTLAWNAGAVRLYGWSEAQALQMNVRERIPLELRTGAMDTLADLSRNALLQPALAQRLTASGAVLEVSLLCTALLDDTGQMYAVATTERAQPRAVCGTSP
ncbi:MAG: chemotaxis protein CheB [Rhodoferax sp.]|nr:chemotaxis protein CheB [Rhodoferax sp.]